MAKEYCPKTRRDDYIKGLNKRPLINIYDSIKARCYNKNHSNYKYYGDIGIIMCDRWLESYDNFELDVGVRPENMTLDRIDPSGNYEPNNCRWADASTQSSNKRPYGKVKEKYISMRRGGFRVNCKGLDRTFKTLEDAIYNRDEHLKHNKGY